MENNENFVAEQVTENVEQTTEQTPKMFTQDEVNEIVGKSKARERAKVTKQFERKYGQLETVLKTGTGKDSVEEIADEFKQHYERRGVKFPSKPAYSAEDIEVLAQADANEIIRYGFDEVVEETDRLANLGAENMTDREKAVFKVLADHRHKTEMDRELTKIGITQDVYNSDEFKEFASLFKPTTPVKEVYDLYRKQHPQKEYKTMGSMKNTDSGDNGIKDFYTPEEARKIPREAYYKNPALQAAVERSMEKWK